MATPVIAYIPALHQGYINFLTKHPGPLYVLSLELVREVPHMDRDIRAMEAANVAKMITSLGLSQSVEVLSRDNLSAVIATLKDATLPDEDVSRRFAEDHLGTIKAEFVPTFLRWDRQISTKEFEVSPDRKVTTAERDKEFIAMAADDAAKSTDWWRQVGALITKDGQPVLVGHNEALPSEDYVVNVFGDPRANFNAGEHIELSRVLHAEAGLIAHAAKNGIALEGASMYVTVFPCPVCAKSIAASGIKHVYYDQGYSLLDAEDILRAYNVELIWVDKRTPPS